MPKATNSLIGMKDTAIQTTINAHKIKSEVLGSLQLNTFSNNTELKNVYIFCKF
jgi:hypothetical protein